MSSDSRREANLLMVPLATNDEESLRELSRRREAQGWAGKATAVLLARTGQLATARTVVASVQEAAAIKEAVGSEMVVVTPGIRLAGDDAHDQARVSTPAQAVAAGADYLVIGRSITGAPDPAAVLQRVHEEMAGPSAVSTA